MNNLNLVRGLFLMAIALIFGVGAFLNYKFGEFSKPGPGMFPLLVSCMLFLLGLLTAVRAFVLSPVALHFNVRNIAIILSGLCGFALLSQYLDMSLGILFLVFGTALAGSTFSWRRNIKVSVVLIVIAYVFKYWLQLNLPLVPLPAPVAEPFAHVPAFVFSAFANLFNLFRALF